MFQLFNKKTVKTFRQRSLALLGSEASRGVEALPQHAKEAFGKSFTKSM
jgi:hypothetical protein